MKPPRRNGWTRSDSNRSEGKERVVFHHRALITNEHDAAGTFGSDGRLLRAAQRMDIAQELSLADALTQFRSGDEQAIARRRMVNLQVSFLRVSGRSHFLPAQASPRRGQAAAPNEKILESSLERAQIAWLESASTAALGVDGGNVTSMRGAQRAAGQERSGPAPEVIEAGGHRPLGATHGVVASQEARPRQKLVGASTTVQINVVTGLRQQLRVEEMRQPNAGGAAKRARESARQIAAIRGMITTTGEEGRLVEHRYHDDRAPQFIGAPCFRPLAQQRRTFVFVAMRAAVQQKHRPESTAPNPRVEAHLVRLEAAAVKARSECFEIVTQLCCRSCHGEKI